MTETSDILQRTFDEVFLKLGIGQQLIKQYWDEVELNYREKKRHYHTSQHLVYMLTELLSCKPMINDWDTMLFALYYHDIIYKPRRKDNEEQSALIAVKRLAAIHYAPARCAMCSQHILATKHHVVSKSSDTNIFTDADLAILGADAEKYHLYIKQIRKEYSVYPDFMYRPGRKKVLQHFLSMERIFKTTFFYEKYEARAKENILAELQSL